MHLSICGKISSAVFSSAVLNKMDDMLAESTQASLIPGVCSDIYYPDPDNSKKACFRTTQNTKFSQAFANLGAGVSVFSLPPSNGYQHIVVQFQLPDLTGANTGLAVPRGWGYGLINRLSYRVGGSSMFFITGDQILNDAIRQSPNSGARDDLFALGGQQLSGVALAGTGNFGFVWLAVPWCRPTAEGQLTPLPSDLLTQMVQVQVELNPLSSIFTAAGVGPSPIPTALASATFTAQQIQLGNQGDALARRVDMTTNSLSYPCSFSQQKVVVPLASTTAPQSVSLTGFRAGECVKIIAWLSKDSDASGSAPASAKNPNRTYLPSSIQMTYAGEVFANYSATSYQLWNLINGKQTSKWAGSTLTFGGGAYTGTPADYHYVELPFAQPYVVTETGSRMLVSGKEITNGQVALQIATPDASADYKLNVTYVYNTVLVFSAGSADFAF